MAVQLRFEGDPIGDHFIKVMPLDVLLSPPARRVGLYQQLAAINADSRNYLYGRQFVVAVTRDNPVLLDAALKSISELQGQTGDIELEWDADDVTFTQWTIESVNVPNIADGYGGRHAPEVLITAVGNTPPSYS